MCLLPKSNRSTTATRNHMFSIPTLYTHTVCTIVCIVDYLVVIGRAVRQFVVFRSFRFGFATVIVRSFFLCISKLDHSNDIKDFAQSCAHYITGERTYVLQQSISAFFLYILLLSVLLTHSAFRLLRRLYIHEHMH